MPATTSDVFVLKNSGLDAFLYADVGAEANGSTLTVLSILARLGKDPWAEAASWAALPRAAVIDSLAQSIAEMPLAPTALAGARASAARLVQLLPTHAPGLRQGRAARSATALPMTMLCGAFIVWMAVNVLLTAKPASDVQAPSEQSNTTAAAHPAPSTTVK